MRRIIGIGFGLLLVLASAGVRTITMAHGRGGRDESIRVRDRGAGGCDGRLIWLECGPGCASKRYL